MFFIALTFITAFLIEGLGTLVSVIGLSSLFGSNLIIIALAIALDLGKIVVVSLLYTYWDKLGAVMKTYALVAAMVTMTITSAGAAGYLTGKFQEAILGSQESSVRLNILLDEQKQLMARKQQIDDQIASIPDRYTASQKVRLMNQFKAEQSTITARLATINQELPELKVADLSKQAKAGPIILLAKSFNTTIEEAILWVVMMIIFVFDPLAVFLIIAGNFLVAQRNRENNQNSSINQTEIPTVEALPAINETEFSTPIPEINNPIIETFKAQEAPIDFDLELVPIEEKVEDIVEYPIQKEKKPRKPRVPKKLKLVPLTEEPAVEKRPEIKLNDLIHKGPKTTSLLDDVPVDNTVSFDDTPSAAGLTTFYKDQTKS